MKEGQYTSSRRMQGGLSKHFSFDVEYSNMQWEVGASSWDQACYAVKKCFKQEKMRFIPKLPFPHDILNIVFKT